MTANPRAELPLSAPEKIKKALFDRLRLDGWDWSGPGQGLFLTALFPQYPVLDKDVYYATPTCDCFVPAVSCAGRCDLELSPFDDLTAP